MFGEASREPKPPAGTEAALLDALDEALDELNEFRAREGAEIARGNAGHNARVARGGRTRWNRSARARRRRFQNRLAERLKELLKGAQIDPQRLAQEAAILADRSDIGEELARLKIHSGATGGAARWRAAKSARSSISCCRR